MSWRPETARGNEKRSYWAARQITMNKQRASAERLLQGAPCPLWSSHVRRPILGQSGSGPLLAFFPPVAVYVLYRTYCSGIQDNINIIATHAYVLHKYGTHPEYYIMYACVVLYNTIGGVSPFEESGLYEQILAGNIT